MIRLPRVNSLEHESPGRHRLSQGRNVAKRPLSSTGPDRQETLAFDGIIDRLLEVRVVLGDRRLERQSGSLLRPPAVEPWVLTGENVRSEH
jgi:hypothetical protein